MVPCPLYPTAINWSRAPTLPHAKQTIVRTARREKCVSVEDLGWASIAMDGMQPRFATRGQEMTQRPIGLIHGCRFHRLGSMVSNGKPWHQPGRHRPDPTCSRSLIGIGRRPIVRAQQPVSCRSRPNHRRNCHMIDRAPVTHPASPSNGWPHPATAAQKPGRQNSQIRKRQVCGTATL